MNKIKLPIYRVPTNRQILYVSHRQRGKERKRTYKFIGFILLRLKGKDPNVTQESLLRCITIKFALFKCSVNSFITFKHSNEGTHVINED